MREQYEQKEQTRRGIKRLIWIVAGIIFVVWVAVGSKDNYGVYQRGDIIKMKVENFATRTYEYDSELGQNALHEDQIAILQMMYDEKVRMVPAGTKGKVIMDKGGLVEVKFEDDPIRNWWVRKSLTTKLN